MVGPELEIPKTTLLMEEIPNNHLGCLQKSYEYWDIDPTSTGCLRFLNHQLRIIGNICCNQKISGILSSPEFPFVKKKKNTMFHKKGPIPQDFTQLGGSFPGPSHPAVLPSTGPCSKVVAPCWAGPRSRGLGWPRCVPKVVERTAPQRAERVPGHRKGSPFLYRPCMAYVPTFGLFLFLW